MNGWTWFIIIGIAWLALMMFAWCLCRAASDRRYNDFYKPKSEKEDHVERNH